MHYLKTSKCRERQSASRDFGIFATVGKMIVPDFSLRKKLCATRTRSNIAVTSLLIIRCRNINVDRKRSLNPP